MRVVLVFLFLSMFLSTKAQSDSELGIITGSSYYMGDLNTRKHFNKSSLLIGVVYKMNFTERYSLRISSSYSKLRGAKEIMSKPYTFESKYMDVAAGLEYNFLPFWIPERPLMYKWTPYVHAGLGMVFAKTGSGITIPFGLGMKFALNDNITLGTEWSFRKTFTDNLDGLSDPNGTGIKSDTINKDWFSYAGVTITYRLSYDRACEAFDKLFK